MVGRRRVATDPPPPKDQLIGEHPDDFRFRDLAPALGDECLDPLEHAHRRNGLDVLEVH